ncbi:MAG: MarR family transcriptional regulator [Cytophagales bacterium]|nr:MarR family transcriptional regulator [Bernardetiaceae bacterium]MDW8209490.1 MarR family transcriptional regulator [Cytophagales bacterium]
MEPLASASPSDNHLDQEFLTQITNYGFIIERTTKRIRQNLQRRFNAHHFGVTVDQWVVLDCIRQCPGISQNEIADRTFKDAPTVTRIIDQLCKKGLTIRLVDENDRRRFIIQLTAKGQKKVNQMLPVVIQMRKEGWKGLDLADYQRLMHIMETIFNNLN